MSEDREEGLIMVEEMDKPLEETGVGPTSFDVTDEQISIGEVPLSELQEEKVQEQNKEVEQAQEEARISKRKQKRRITSYLSNISKQIEKNGNQINKVTTMIQSLQRQKQTKLTTGAGQSQFQSVKQIKSQVDQLQKQVTRIQDDVRRIRSTSVSGTGTRTKFRKRAFSTGVRPMPKKTKSHRSIQSGKQKRSARNRN